MGIHGLMKLLSEECPGCIKEQEFDNYTGRKIAIDASMAMYQFLIAVRFGPGGNQAGSMLMNDAGEVTSHIQGMFNRTIKLMSSGVRPVYVFDGKPPPLKGGELAKRLARRAKAQAELEEAKAKEQVEDMDRFARRLVKVTRHHNEDCQELLRLMGVPVIIAPCEAEAQCAELARKNKVYGTATEDMDALTFRSPKLIRRLTFSPPSAQKEKQSILEIDFELVLKGLNISYEQFVDLCILCGCDYCSTIKGIGPKTALKLIRQYHNIEKIIQVLKKEKKYSIPPDWFPQRIPKNPPPEEEEPQKDQAETKEGGEGEVSTEKKEGEEEKPAVTASNEAKMEEDEDAAAFVEDDEDADHPEEDFNPTTKDGDEDEEDAPEEPEVELVEDENFEVVPPLFVQARHLFLQCEVNDAEGIELKWSEPNEEGLKAFLVDRMGFNAERVMNGIKKLKEAQQTKSQKRMDSFFAPVTTSVSSTGLKRKVEDNKKDANKKAKASGPFKKR